MNLVLFYNAEELWVLLIPDLYSLHGFILNDHELILLFLWTNLYIAFGLSLSDRYNLRAGAMRSRRS